MCAITAACNVKVTGRKGVRQTVRVRQVSGTKRYSK